MATLATFVNRFVGVRSFDAIDHENSHPRVESCRLRPLPNEDVYLFVKRIDNHAVVRAIDPAARRARTNSMLTSFGLALALPVAGQPPSPARVEWKLSTALGPAYPEGKAAAIWAALIAERSAGRLSATLFPGATLAQRDPAREFLALRDGGFSESSSSVGLTTCFVRIVARFSRAND